MKGTPPLGTMGPMVAPGAPIEEAEVRAAIETYTVNLVKAIFQASFFRTQHDLTLKAVDAFLESAVVLGDRFEEITYMASSVETKPEIVVEGLGPEAVPLRSCLRSSLRDEFIGKLHDFFGWNGLVSLSIRRDVRRADLLEFLERTARTSIVPAGAAGAMEPRRHFSDVLAERGIVGITAIRRDDVVFGERVLPWRVRLALARLRKSLRSIPLYARATAQQIREAKVLVLGDIVRPLQRRELLTELLVNCDLVETCGTELEGMDVAWEVAQAVARPRLLVVAAFLAEELERPAATGGPESARRDRLLGAFRTCLACASTVVDDELVALTRNALRLGWLRQDELADNVREYLDLERLAEQFLADPGMHVRRIRETSDAKGFRAFSSTAPILVRELAQRGQYGWVAAIAGALEDQATGKTPAEPEVRSLARAALEGLTPRPWWRRCSPTSRRRTAPPNSRSSSSCAASLLDSPICSSGASPGRPATRPAPRSGCFSSRLAPWPSSRCGPPCGKRTGLPSSTATCCWSSAASPGVRSPACRVPSSGTSRPRSARRRSSRRQRPAGLPSNACCSTPSTTRTSPSRPWPYAISASGDAGTRHFFGSSRTCWRAAAR